MSTSTTQYKRKNKRVPDPTPEEIQLRAAEIRKTWVTGEDNMRRTCGSKTK